MPMSRVTALLAAAVVLFAACGGGTSKPADPVGAVSTAFSIANAGGTLKKMALSSCLTSGLGSVGGGSLFASFATTTQSTLNAQGITSDDVNGAIQVSFDGLSTKEVSRSGGNATVHVDVKINAHVDAGKMRALIKKTLSKGGVVPDDATIDAQIKTALNNQFDQAVTVSKDVNVLLQNDTWVACGPEFAYPTAS